MMVPDTVVPPGSHVLAAAGDTTGILTFLTHPIFAICLAIIGIGLLAAKRNKRMHEVAERSGVGLVGLMWVSLALNITAALALGAWIVHAVFGV